MRATKVTVKFTVLGHPEPGGSKRAVPIPGGGSKVIDANRKVRPWRDLVSSAAERAMFESRNGVLSGPLALALTFYAQRPKSHYGSGRNSAILKPSAPKRPTTRPDVTKLVRSVEDACTSIVWRDDSQVVTQYARKFYGAPERCEVIVQAYISTNGGV